MPYRNSLKVVRVDAELPAHAAERAGLERLPAVLHYGVPAIEGAVAALAPRPVGARIACIRLAYYVIAVIRSWRNAGSRRVWEGGMPNRFRGLDGAAAIDLLLALNVASTLRDLSPLKSVGLHKLKGTRAGQWAMTVNGPWRICFEFRAGDAYDVEIVDYHRG